MLKIVKSTNGGIVFTLSGRMTAADVPGFEALLRSESKDRPRVLDLKNLTLVDRDVVKFLERLEADSIALNNCPAYIREWIKRERDGS